MTDLCSVVVVEPGSEMRRIRKAGPHKTMGTSAARKNNATHTLFPLQRIFARPRFSQWLRHHKTRHGGYEHVERVLAVRESVSRCTVQGPAKVV